MARRSAQLCGNWPATAQRSRACCIPSASAWKQHVKPLAEAVMQQLAAFTKRGGRLLADQTTTLSPPGAGTLPLAVRSILDEYCGAPYNWAGPLPTIYTHTQLESTFAVNALAIDHGRPKTLGMKDVLVVRSLSAHLRGKRPAAHKGCRSCNRQEEPLHRFPLSLHELPIACSICWRSAKSLHRCL